MSRAYWKYNSIHTHIPKCYHPYFYLTVFLVGVLVLLLWLSTETPDLKPYKRRLNRDGYVLIPGGSLKEALRRLPAGYVYLKYRYTIDGCSLSTFHRDVTSSAYVYETKHPVYTFIVYRSAAPNTPLLSVCPGSHRTTPFLFSSPVVVSSGVDSLQIRAFCLTAIWSTLARWTETTPAATSSNTKSPTWTICRN